MEGDGHINSINGSSTDSCSVLAKSPIEGKIAIALSSLDKEYQEHFACFSSVTYSCSNLNAYCGDNCDPNDFGRQYTKLETLLLILFFFVLSICVALGFKLYQGKVRAAPYQRSGNSSPPPKKDGDEILKV